MAETNMRSMIGSVYADQIGGRHVLIDWNSTYNSFRVVPWDIPRRRPPSISWFNHVPDYMLVKPPLPEAAVVTRGAARCTRLGDEARYETVTRGPDEDPFPEGHTYYAVSLWDRGVFKTLILAGFRRWEAWTQALDHYAHCTDYQKTDVSVLILMNLHADHERATAAWWRNSGGEPPACGGPAPTGAL